MSSLKIIPYKELSLDEFHDIIALRIAVFVIEQDCPYQELDGWDKRSWHLIYEVDKSILATLRILPPNTIYSAWSIGRVVVHEDLRGRSVGHEVMNASIDFVKSQSSNETVSIKISAQEHLMNFYGTHGFSQCGEGYLEDGIPHIPMCLESS